MKDKVLVTTHEDRERYIFIDTINIILSIVNIVFSVVTVNTEKASMSMYFVIFVSCAAIFFLNIWRLHKVRRMMAILNGIGFALLLALNLYLVFKR